MATAIIVQNVTLEEIDTKFKALQIRLDQLIAGLNPNIPAEYLTRSEVAELLKCDLSTVHNWTKKGKLKPYGIGNRVYYKLSEIEAAIVPLKSK